MASYYTYGTVPSAEETVFGPLSQGYAEGGEVDEAVPADRGLPEEPYYGPSEEYNDPQPMPQNRSDQTAAPYIPPGLEAAFLRMQGKSPEQLAAKSQYVAETQRERDVLSSLLQSNQFDAAFEYAKQNNVENLLIDPTELQTLKSNFTPEEIKKFFAEMPKDLMGEQSEEEVKFDPAAGLEASLQQQTMPSGLSALGLGSGVPQVQRAFIPLEQKKEDGLFEDIIKTVLAAGTLYAGASALPGLIGAGSAGGTAAGTAAGGTTAAGGATAAGATAAGTAAAAAPLAEVVITASKLGLTIPQAATLLATTGAGVSALGGGAAPTAPTAPTPEAPLDEIVVTGKRALDPALRGLIPTSLASTNLMQGVSDIPTDIYGQPEAVEPAEQPQQEPAQDDLEQVLVQTGRVQPGVLDLAAIGTGGLTAADLLRGYTEPTLRPYEELPPETEVPAEEEVVVTGSRPPPIDLAGVGVGGLTAAQLLQGYTQPNLRPYEQLPPEGEPMDEIVVKGSKITPIDLAGIGVGGLTAAQLLQGFTQPKVDPFTGETKQPSKTEQELDKIQDALKTGAPIPGTSSFLKDLLNKYGTLENALKAIGAIGSAFSKTPTVGTGTGGAAGTGGGMGGALPKYNYARQQLSPDIDYYTYGTRPEARFFQDSLQLEKPVQPQLPPAKTPDQESPVIASVAPLSDGPRVAEEDPEFYKKYVQDQNVPSPLTPVNEHMRPSGDRIDWFNLWTQKSKMSPERYDEYVQRMAPLSGMSEGDYRNYLSERSAENAAEIAYRQSDAGRAAMLAQQEEARRNAMNAGLTMSVPEAVVEKPKEPGMATGGLTGYAKGGSKSSRYVDGPGSGREDKIPALLSDGEYVIDAETLALLGDGSTKEGARRMDKFRANIRKHKGRALSRGRISPNAKSPDKYMGGGLT